MIQSNTYPTHLLWLGSLNEAKSKAKRAELTSDLSDFCENKANQKFKTKKNTYSPSPDCISSESDDDCPIFLSGLYF